MNKPRRLRKLHIDRTDLVDAPANAPALVGLLKSDDAPVVKNSDTVEAMMSLDKSKLTEAVRKHLEELEASNPDAAAELAEALAPAQAPAPVVEITESVEKSELATLRKSLEDERTARLEGEKRIAKMEADRKLAGFVALAKADLEPIGKADEVAAVLLAVSEAVPTETYQTLERLLKSAAAQLTSGNVFVQRADTAAVSTDAEDKIDTLAKEIFKAGGAATIELAKLKVVESHPELYREYAAERTQ